LKLAGVHQADAGRPEQIVLSAMTKKPAKEMHQRLRPVTPPVFQDLRGQSFHGGMTVAGLLIDGRCSPTLELVTNNFVKQLPGMPLYFFHAKANEAYAHHIKSNLIDNVHVLALPEPWYSTLDWSSYQTLMTYRGLWQGLTTLAWTVCSWWQVTRGSVKVQLKSCLSS